MASTTPGSCDDGSDQPELLETWDQIAFHLRVTTATAKRWEKEGLPVHRQLRTKIGRVFAYKPELDAWVRSRTTDPLPKVAESSLQPSAAAPLPSETPWERIKLLLYTSQSSPPRRRFWFASFLIGVLGIGAVLSMGYHRINPRDPTSTPILLGQGVQEHPDLSPDGTQIALAWDQGHPAERHIFVVPVAGGPPRQLTSISNSETFPRWSPDGRRLAFGRYTGQGFVALTLFDIQRGEERTIAEAQGDATYLDWTPDGRSIVFTDRATNGSFALFSVDLDSGQRRQITSPTAGFLGDLQCAVSPDGRRIAFARFQTRSEADLFVMPAEGGPSRRVTHDACKIEGLTWADGSTVVYSANRQTSRLELWKVRCEDRSSGQPSQISHVASAGADAVYPSFPSGTNRNRLVYQHRRRDTHLFAETISPTNPTSERVIGEEGYNGMPAVSPSGDRIAFVSDRTGHAELYVASRQGENQQRITNFAGAVLGAPAWSHSGERIAFSAASSGFCGIYQIAPDGRGLAEQVIFEQHGCGDATWSRDEHWLYFRSTRSGSAQIWKIGADSENLQQLTTEGGFEGFESGDASSFYYIKSGGPVAVTAPTEPVYRMPVAGGPSIALPIKVRMSFWTLVDSGVLYLRLWENDTDTKLYRYRFATGRVEPVFAIPARSDRLSQIAARGDGGSIYWGQMDRHSSDVILLDGWR
jgi:Tol biopolymer transport system component